MLQPFNRFVCAALLVTAGGTAPAQAAVVIESRHTQLQAATQWGYPGNVQTDSYQFESSSLTSDFQSVLGGSRQGDGALGDGSWIANFDFSMDQQIEIQPGRSVSASGSLSVFAFVGDQGISVVDARPGNRLELGFSVEVPEAILFSGQATDFASISLEQHLGGGTWVPLVGPSSGSLLSGLTLEPGQYRVLAEGLGYHDGSAAAGSSWTFTVSTVPEPSVWALAGAGLLAGFGWRRIRRRAE